MGEICSKLTINTPEWRWWSRSGIFIVNFERRRSGIFIVNFEQILQFLNKISLFLKKKTFHIVFERVNAKWKDSQSSRHLPAHS